MFQPEQKTFYTLDYDDFDKLIEDAFGFVYESVAENEWNNDMCYRFTGIGIPSAIDKDGMFYSYFLKRAHEDVEAYGKHFLGIGDYRSLRARDVLLTLHDKGLLPAGDYLIEVSW